MSYWSYYHCLCEILPSAMRIIFIARVCAQLYYIYFYPEDISELQNLLEDGWSLNAASGKYILLRSCESVITLIGLACILSITTRFMHKAFLSFMWIANEESASLAGALAGWLFFVIGIQCGITSLPDEERFWRVLRNIGIISIVNLHSLYKPISNRLQSLSASRSKSIQKHARALVIALATIGVPAQFLIYLWSQQSINSWTLTVTVFGFEIIFKMTIALIIYNLIMINHFLEVDWQLEDAIYYLKALSGLVSYLCGISLFFNGAWVLVFENSTAMRALSLGVHLYLNVWSQALKGLNAFNKRRLAGTKITYLRDATEEELIDLNDVCSICFQRLTEAKTTDCKHFFHAECLTRWLYLQDSCPLCFRQLFDNSSCKPLYKASVTIQ